jgi:hypothetical protein
MPAQQAVGACADDEVIALGAEPAVASLGDDHVDFAQSRRLKPLLQ